MTNVYYWPFEFGRKTKANKMLQEVLADNGYYTGDIDGIFGTSTKIAIENMQRRNNLPVTGQVDRATEDLLFPGNYERRTPSMLLSSTWLSSIVMSTGFKYFLTLLGSILAGYLGLPEGDINAILLQIVSVIPGIWGMIEAAKSKIVANGKVINLAKTDTATQQQAAKLVADVKRVPVSEVLKKAA